MSLVKRTPNTLPFLFEDILKTDWFGGVANDEKICRHIPAVNVEETQDTFIVSLAAPGKTKEDFEITLDNDILTISSEIKSNNSNEDADRKFTRKEFSYTSFKRTFTIPETVNTADITAAYEHGILVLSLPKREEAKEQPKRLIAIK